MGLFRKNPIEPAALLEKIVRNKNVQALQQGAPVDVAATLMGLADVESAFDLGAQGDKADDGKTQAWGPWQINSRVHTFDTVRILVDADYAIDVAVKVLAEVLGIVRKGYTIQRQRRDAGESLKFNAGRDVPAWCNIGWQYGTGGLLAFLQSSSDLGPDAFPVHRSAIGKPAEGGYASRVARFRSRYSAVVADPPAFWRDVVAKSGSDLKAAPGKVAAAAADFVKDKIPSPKSIFDGVLSVVKGYLLVLALLVVGGVVLLVAFREEIRALLFGRAIVVGGSK